MLDFQKRKNTKYLYLCYKDLQGFSFNAYLNDKQCQGEYDTGYHFFIARNDVYMSDRDYLAVAGHDLENNTEAVYVLIDLPADDKLTDNQRYNTTKIINKVRSDYGKDIKIIKEY